MSVCAKFQLSSWSRSGWKVCGSGWWVGNTWLLCLTPTLVALELFWVELSYVGFWQKLWTSLAGSATLDDTSWVRLTFHLRVSCPMLKLELGHRGYNYRIHLGGTPHIQLVWSLHSIQNQGGTPHITPHTTQNQGGTPHMKMCLDNYTGVGTPH